MEQSASGTFGVCPRCGDPVAFSGFGGARSRKDSQTLVCDDCSWLEYLWIWINSGTEEDLPDVDVDLREVLS